MGTKRVHGCQFSRLCQNQPTFTVGNDTLILNPSFE